VTVGNGFAGGTCSWIRATNVRPPKVESPLGESRACSPMNSLRISLEMAQDRETQ